MGAVGRLVREEAHPIFTRWGVVGHGKGNAAQAACIPVRHIVEEVSGRFGAAGLEYFLLPAYGEPLGAPVHSFFFFLNEKEAIFMYLLHKQSP